MLQAMAKAKAMSFQKPVQLAASSIALTQDEDAVEDSHDSFAEEDSIAMDEST